MGQLSTSFASGEVLSADKLNSIVTAHNETEAAVSDIKATADAVSILVSKKNGSAVVNTAAIVAAINDEGSGVSISADKIALDGLTFVKALQVNEIEVGEGVENVVDASGNVTKYNKGYIDGQVYSNFKITKPETYDGTPMVVQDKDYNDSLHVYNLAAHAFVIPLPTSDLVGKHIKLHVGKWANDTLNSKAAGLGIASLPKERAKHYYDIAIVCPGLTAMFGCESGTNKHGVVLSKGNVSDGHYGSVELCCMEVPFNNSGNIVYKPRWVPQAGVTFIDDVMADSKASQYGAVNALRFDSNLAKAIEQTATCKEEVDMTEDAASKLESADREIFTYMNSPFFLSENTSNKNINLYIDVAALEAFDYKMPYVIDSRGEYSIGGVSAGFIEPDGISGGYRNADDIIPATSSMLVQRYAAPNQAQQAYGVITFDKSWFQQHNYLVSNEGHCQFSFTAFYKVNGKLVSESYNFMKNKREAYDAGYDEEGQHGYYGSFVVRNLTNKESVIMKFDAIRFFESGKTALDITALNNDSVANAVVDSESNLSSAHQWDVSRFSSDAYIGVSLFDGAYRTGLADSVVSDPTQTASYHSQIIRDVISGCEYTDYGELRIRGLKIESINSELASKGTTQVGSRTLASTPITFSAAMGVAENVSMGGLQRWRMTPGTTGATVLRLTWTIGKHSLVKYLVVYQQ